MTALHAAGRRLRARVASWARRAERSALDRLLRRRAALTPPVAGQVWARGPVVYRLRPYVVDHLVRVEADAHGAGVSHTWITNVVGFAQFVEESGLTLVHEPTR